MSKENQNQSFIKSPFRLPSQTKRHHQWYFLHFINRTTPKVRKAINLLTPHCIELFGKPPSSNDIEKKSNSLNLEFSDIFNECIWKDSRENYNNFNWVPVLGKNDESYGNVINLKRSKSELLTNFQNEFDLLLKEFCLEKRWLAASVFEAIWNSTGILQMSSGFMETISKEVISEIKKRLGKKEIIKVGNRTVDEYDDLLMQNIPLPNPFEYVEQYWIYDSFEEYEEEAIESYRQHLRNYFEIIKESFKMFGYKQSRKPFDYKRVEWLVLWNIECWNKDKILQEICDTTDEFLSLDTVDKAFRQFKKYDLPVRIDKRK